MDALMDQINKVFAANLEIVNGAELKQQADMLALLNNCTVAIVGAILHAGEANLD